VFYLLLCSIPWSVEYSFSSGLGTDLPDEPLMFLTAAIAICMAAFQYRKIIAARRMHPLLFLLLLQLLWLVLTVVLSSYFTLSAKYFAAKTWYVLAFVTMPVFLWQEKKVLTTSVVVLAVSMILVTAVTLLRHAALGFTFSTVNEALKPFFRNHVNYSALLVFMLPLQLAFLQQAKSRNIRLLVLLSFFITLPALYFSFARGAWLALLTGASGYWLIKKRWLVKSFLLAVIFFTATVFWLKQNDRYLQFAHHYQSTIFHQNFEEHLVATYQLKDLSTAERFYRWVAGIRMIDDSWQTGFGPTTFYRHYKGYTVPAFKTWVSRNEEQSTVHNYFLLLIIEQGAIGLILFVLLLGMLFWYAQKIYHRTNSKFWRTSVAAVACILVMECTVNFLSDLVETDKAGSVFYLCLAMLVIADRKTAPQA
jgi:O-antigen ligase